MWSALTCQRFGKRRLVAARLASWFGRDKSRSTKAVTSYRTPTFRHSHGPSLYFCLVPSYFCLMVKCPTCGKAVEWKDNLWRPFCSERCKLIDFGRWANEEYLVPGQKIDSVEIGEQPHTGEANIMTDEES